MSVSDNIRALAQDGLSTAEIARRLGIRYQHAYNVLKGRRATVSISNAPPLSHEFPVAVPAPQKPPLVADTLIAGGFTLTGRWVLSSTGNLVLDQPFPEAAGVYAFTKDGIALYVGVATMGLAKRLYFYRRPGVTQRTSQRLNGIIKSELTTVPAIDVYTAIPPDLEWNGLPIHGSAGLELGLIKRYSLPWNMRSSK
jgi:hypothetical protein